MASQKLKNNLETKAVFWTASTRMSHHLATKTSSIKGSPTLVPFIKQSSRNDFTLHADLECTKLK